MPPPEDRAAAELRAKATRARRLAENFRHDELAPRLRAVADKWEAQAAELEAEVKS